MTEPIRPSSVQKWSQCPQRWYYEDVEGWKQPAFHPQMIQSLVGTALHAGMASHWKHRDNHESWPSSRAEAQLVLVKGWVSNAEYTFEGISALLDKMLSGTIAWCENHMEDAIPLMIEQPLGADGHTTPDLVTRESGKIVVTDYKTSIQINPGSLYYRLEGSERSHQFQHYTWAVGEHLKEPVSLFRKLQIVGLPKVKVEEATFVPNPDAQREWLRQAKIKWHDMAKMRDGGDLHGGLVYRREDGCLPYGEKYPCPMYAACWTCHGDREMMKNFYVKGEQRA